ncbi:MAG: hypothetical protein ACE5K4_10520 [Candidatus Hydrothermarchaeota archaeon]
MFKKNDVELLRRISDLENNYRYLLQELKILKAKHEILTRTIVRLSKNEKK